MNTSSVSSRGKWRIGDWIADPVAAELYLAPSEDNHKRRLERRAMDVLVYLAERSGEVVSKEELLTAIWGRAAISDNAVAIVIAQLRKTLGDDKAEPRYLQTIPKRGYKLICSAELLPDKVIKQHPSVRHKLLIAVAVLGMVGVALFVNRILSPQLSGYSVLLVSEITNETGEEQWTQLGRTVTTLLAQGLAGNSQWELIRWQSGLSEPTLWSEIATITQDRHAVVVGGQVIEGREGPEIALSIYDGSSGAVLYQSAEPVEGIDAGRLVESWLPEIEALASR